MQIKRCPKCDRDILPTNKDECPSCSTPLGAVSYAELQAAPKQEQTPPAGNTRKRTGYYGGIARLGYWIGTILITTVQIVAFFLLVTGSPHDLGFLIGIVTAVVAIIATFGLVVSRLHNLGMSGWWSLLLPVPLVNLIVGFRCLVCQEGYQDEKQLDATGRVLIWVLVGLFLVLPLLAAVIIPMVGPATAK